MILLNFFTFIILVILFFYRKPKLFIQRNNYDKVYSPAHGTIINIKEDTTHIFIAIFLSPLDIHYQFYPVSGKVTSIVYDNTGKYELAYNINKSKDNEKCIHTIINSNGEFKVYQIAGYFVRRISYYDKPNTNVTSGDILGLIHFGSRVDVLIPKHNFKLLVKEKEKVNNKTLLGYFN